jgi:hypothetical protein
MKTQSLLRPTATRIAIFLTLLAQSQCGSDGSTAAGDAAAVQVTPDAATVTVTPDAGVALDGGGTMVSSADGASPSGWLYTSGNHLYLSGSVWMGRGVNMDDLYLCGANSTLTSTSAEQNLKAVVDALMTWKPNFVRVSLWMDSFPTTTSWTSGSSYATQMTSVIDYIGQTYPGVYVLVTLRTDTSMDCPNLPSNDATCLPTANTDPVFKALVDSFAQSNFVMFALSNEPGGYDGFTPEQISSAMSHAVSTIRAEEDALNAPHHIISVQGTASTSNLTYYLTTPIQSDNIVYELHFYPDSNTDETATNYAYASTLPAIVGEYGGFDPTYESQTQFYSDMESMQIPNLAWDYEPFSNCSPDLTNIGAADAGPTAWGQTVMAYLAAH